MLGVWVVEVGRGMFGGKRDGWGVPRAGNVSGISAEDGIGEEGNRFGIEVFDEGNMEGIEDFIRDGVPKAVSFGVRTIANHYARDGSGKEFGIVGVDEGIGTTANFAKMRERGQTIEPKLIRSSSIEGRRGRQVCKEGGGSAKLVPHGRRRLTGKTHRTCLFKNSAMQTLCAPVMGRSVRSGK